jgi:hypothetical protein
MNDPQIDEKHPNSPQIHPFQVVGMKMPILISLSIPSLLLIIFVCVSNHV